MGFGPPPAARPNQSQETHTASQFPTVYVLKVRLSSGGFSNERNIAAGTDRQSLEQFLGEWLKVDGNRNNYQSSLVDTVPFVSPL